MRTALFLAAAFLPFAAYAADPVPPVVSEELKIRALKLGYILNGESMTRAPGLGSIDVTGLLYEMPPPIRLAPVAKAGDAK